jgi:ParB-like chromosome segregation protein Spo0J
VAGNIIEVELEKIHPNLRLIYSDETIAELCRFISNGGEIDPLEIWFDGEGFRMKDGEKRWRACKRLRIIRVKARLIDYP